MKTLIILSTLIPTLLYGGNFLRVFYDGTNVWVSPSKSFHTLSPLEKYEVSQTNGKRFPINYRGLPFETNLIEVVDEFSDPVTTQMVEVVSYALELPAKYLKWNGSDVEAMTQAERDAVDQAEAAAAQAAQLTQLQSIVDQAGPQIRQIESIIDKYSIPRPASPASCLSVIGAVKEQAEATGDSLTVAIAGADGVILMALYDGLSKAGITAETINQVWQFMVATGQTGR